MPRARYPGSHRRFRPLAYKTTRVSGVNGTLRYAAVCHPRLLLAPSELVRSSRIFTTSRKFQHAARAQIFPTVEFYTRKNLFFFFFLNKDTFSICFLMFSLLLKYIFFPKVSSRKLKTNVIRFFHRATRFCPTCDAHVLLKIIDTIRLENFQIYILCVEHLDAICTYKIT